MTWPELIFLVGPTAVGKTEIAIHLAGALEAEILSIDSRQAYRRLELGTAKPTAAERATVTHHLLDLFAPNEQASAGRFARCFAQERAALTRRGKRALAVGGSGLYVDACLGRLDPLPTANERIRAEHARLAARDPEELHRRLRAVDPESASRLAPADTQRVSRALEVYEQTGVPLSRLQTRGEQPLDLRGGPPMIVLERGREDLYGRIERRCRAMIAGGLVEEVRRLLAEGVAEDAPGMEAIGYRELSRFLRGKLTEPEATEQFIRATRRYAKRQSTWFRNRYRHTIRIRITGGEPLEQTADRATEALARASQSSA